LSDLNYAGDGGVSMKPETYSVPLDVLVFAKPDER
jgi:hypothetical protein